MSPIGGTQDGFKFRRDKDFNNSRVWRCIEKGCGSRCKTDLDELMILGGRFEHNHVEPDTRKLERQKVRQNCKRKAAEEPSERPSKLIVSEIEKNEVNELLPQDIKSVRQAIYRQRRKTQPKLPKSREETIQTLKEYEVLSNGENMVYISDAETEIVMITTKCNLEFLCQEDVQVFGDGTFQYSAKFFYQLYTLHGYKNEQYVPCVFFRLPSKTKECYRQMFQHLIVTCQENNCVLNLTSLHLDFETVVREAAKHFWPDINIKG